jgi:hypothetical protein
MHAPIGITGIGETARFVLMIRIFMIFSNGYRDSLQQAAENLDSQGKNIIVSFATPQAAGKRSLGIQGGQGIVHTVFNYITKKMI